MARRWRNNRALILWCLSVATRIKASTEPFDNFQSFTFTAAPEENNPSDDPSASSYSIISSSLIYQTDGSNDGFDKYVIAEEFYDRSDQTDDDEDDDDDDDDDGHSSMLSTSSLRRRVSVGDGGFDTDYPSKISSSSSAAVSLQMRGGGSQSHALAFEFGGSELARRLYVTALVTLMFELCVGHILEFIKIVRQTSPDLSYSQVIGAVTSEKGVLGLWDGFVPWGVVQAISKGAVFGLAHATAKKYLVPLGNDGTIPMLLALTIAGGVGGGFQGYVLSPTLLLKTRVMTNPVFRESMSMLQTLWLSVTIGVRVVRQEGILTLMKGSNVFALKRVFDWSSRYLFSDCIESALFTLRTEATTLSVKEKSLASILGGVLSTCVTLPLDVLVAKTQDAKKAGVKVSALAMFSQELKEKGWNGLRDSYMQGFEARLLHVCLTTVVIKTVAPLAYDEIYKISS